MTLTLASIDQYLSYMSAHGSSANTLRAYKTDLLDLYAAAGDLSTEEMELAAARWLTAGRTRWAPATTRRKCAAVRGLARWAGAGAILASYRLPDPGKPQPHPIPEGMAGVDRLLEACGRDMQSRAMIALCGKLGLRLAETLSTSPSSFDLEDRTIRVVGKGDKVRVLPVPAALWEHLTPAMAGAGYAGPGAALVPLCDSAARERITKLGVAAGLSRPLASHDLRATFATHLYDTTKDLRLVQEFLGHADSKTTQVYTAVTMTSMRAALEAAA